MTVEYSETGMRATFPVSAAVSRAVRPRRCEECRRRRVCFALTITYAALGNPEYPWRCAPCWGLR